MYQYVISLLIICALGGCQGNSNGSKTESSSNIYEDSASRTTQSELEISDTPTKIGLASDVIEKVNSQMGLGTLLAWENDADPGSPPNYFTTLEYEILPAKESLVNTNNVIELSIGSEGATGKYAEYLRITVGFMNPDDEVKANKLYLNKVDQLLSLFKIPYPMEIKKSLQSESNLVLTQEAYTYEVEVYGASRKWITLKVS
jgi:hypothetical protein